MIDQATQGLAKDRALILNAGNIINSKAPFNHITAKYIMKMLALSGVEVLGIGPHDITLGRENLLQLTQHSPINVVSANLPGFLPYVRLRKAGGRIRVLVTSIIDPEIIKKYQLKYDGKILDPVIALKRLQKEIDHDYFIVIVHAMGERISEIINGCPGIDLAIDGLTRSISDNLDKKGVVPLVCNNRRGQYVNYLEYHPNARKTLSSVVMLRASMKKVKEDPEIKQITESYNKERIAYSEQQRQKKIFHAVQQDLLKSPPNLYLGNQACESCHPVSVKKWQKTRHAHAMHTLVKKGRESDPECVKCHVTGMPIQPLTNLDKRKNEVGGFTSISETPRMANVQCEACHGPGANHAQNPSQNKMRLMNGSGCRNCHTEETDPDFKFKNKYKLIEHLDNEGK